LARGAPCRYPISGEWQTDVPWCAAYFLQSLLSPNSNLYHYVMASYLYLVEELKYKPSSIVLFGRSLGSGPVCRLAQRLQEQGDKVGGVILHSPFVSIREAGLSLLGPVASIISDRWDNREPLAELKCRLLIIHGASDEVVPFVHAELLREIRKRNNLHCSFFPTQGTHNYFSYYRDYLHPVETFLTGHDKSKLPPLPVGLYKLISVYP
jgi:pimeloyl-ACP methyl ester carboxylesterase